MHRTQRYFLIIYIILISCVSAFSQINEINGTVVDRTSGDPLPFVNIIVNSDPLKGTITDIDGKFRIRSEDPVRSLTFSFTGYRRTVLTAEEMQDGPLTVRLPREEVKLQEVTVFPGENPAHRIIEAAIDNRKINDPERLSSFKYKSYNKLLITGTGGMDSMGSGFKEPVRPKEMTRSDSLMFNLLDSQHIFIMETISERIYVRPNLDNEKVKATKVSGLRNPDFFLLATQLQPFAFYEDHIPLYDKNFLNPITPGSTAKYLFLLQDTLYSGSDSIFVISFRPRKGKNFNGLKGLLYINTKRFAIQYVIAEPYEAMPISIRIQQQYEWIENRQWFPTQLNTDMIFNNMEFGKQKTTGIGRTYLEEISIDPELDWKSFNRFHVEMEPGATRKSSSYWEENRTVPLDAKEIRTYEVMDSIGREAKLDEKIFIITSLLEGAIPIGFINIPLDRIINYNDHEGLRLGAGITTNERLSRHFSVGGYFAYGFHDKDWKYGADASWNIWRRNELKLRVKYENDVVESGSYTFIQQQGFLVGDWLRDYIVDDMYKRRLYEASIEMRLFKYLFIQPFMAYEIDYTTNDYIFSPGENGIDIQPWQEYNFTETGIRLKYAYGEKLVFNQKKVISMGTKYPVLWLNYTRGIADLEEVWEYHKVVAEIKRSFLLRNIGTSSFKLSAGFADGPLPYFKLFNSFGSHEENSFYLVEESFNTMLINEYLADRFVTFFYSHNFGKLLIKTDHFRPEFVISTAVGFGGLNDRASHQVREFKVMNKGYFESGLIINNIISMNYFNAGRLGFGIGAFYNYGPYASDNWKENIALKMSFILGT